MLKHLITWDKESISSFWYSNEIFWKVNVFFFLVICWKVNVCDGEWFLHQNLFFLNKENFVGLDMYIFIILGTQLFINIYFSKYHLNKLTFSIWNILLVVLLLVPGTFTKSLSRNVVKIWTRNLKVRTNITWITFS